jgi:hypothetical protein
LVAGFPKITVAESSMSATEEYIIRTSDVTTLIAICFPGQLEGLPGGTHRYYLPGYPLICRSVSFEPHTGEIPGDPFDADGGASASTYDAYTRATLNYDSGDDGTGEDGQETPPGSQTEVAGHSITVGGSAITISPDKVTIATDDDGTLEAANTPDADGNLRADAAAMARQEVRNDLSPLVKIVPDLEHTLKVGGKQNPNWAGMVDALGKVNRTTTGDVMDHFSPAKISTVLFMGYSAQKKYISRFDENGELKGKTEEWDIDFRFKQRYVTESGVVRGWNHVWNGTLQKWVVALRAAIKRDGSVDTTKGKPLYEKADFNDFLD